MDRSAAEEISSYVGSVPYCLDCVQAVAMRRPRYAWTSENLEALMPDVKVIPRGYWKDVEAFAEYPNTDQWLTPGCQWEGEKSGAVFPTCMKRIGHLQCGPLDWKSAMRVQNNDGWRIVFDTPHINMTRNSSSRRNCYWGMASITQS